MCCVLFLTNFFTLFESFTAHCNPLLHFIIGIQKVSGDTFLTRGIAESYPPGCFISSPRILFAYTKPSPGYFLGGYFISPHRPGPLQRPHSRAMHALIVRFVLHCLLIEDTIGTSCACWCTSRSSFLLQIILQTYTDASPLRDVLPRSSVR